MLRGQSGRHVGAQVLTDHGERVVAQRAHQGQAVQHHLMPERRPRLVHSAGRAAIAAQVWADDGVLDGEDRGEFVPDVQGAGVSVQEQDRRAGALVTDAQGYVPQVDPVLEHSHSIPTGAGRLHAPPVRAKRARSTFVYIDESLLLLNERRYCLAHIDVLQSAGGHRAACSQEVW